MNAASTKRPDDPRIVMGIAAAYAFLGEKAEVLANMKRSEELLPESRDAILGFQYSMARLYVRAWVGEKGRTLAELERLLHVPRAANRYSTTPSLRPPRDMPRFKELMSDPKNNEPIPL